ncbi:MAG: HEAT repeat domain-containing protein [Nostoc sp. NMS7]|uniref:HEAT repeat domain-containing protein n=1 Tax=Nostoc sp. NMS7 TaxID=2815391 RepID=UPI0025E1E0E5|nr:HEAT repeat domain-containing protein [Nostoc sp. NMS7]MBN3945144.1 HEAT repeat domain-containing protein [Nostoc sp. NMS7]
MGETRNRNSVRVNEEGKKKLLDAKAAIGKYEGKRLTQLELAGRAAVGEKTVKRFFSGKEDVDWESASAIAKALDLELIDLIDVKATTLPLETTATSIDWHEVCSTMLEPQRRMTSNPLMQNESAKKERKQIYVPLALVQRTKTDKRNKEDFSPDAGTRLYEPEYETQQRFEHEAFLSQILERGSGKTKGQQIAVIGEPGAGKTTLLQAIAFWVLEKDLGLPIWVSLADLGRNGTLTDIQTYIFNSWLEQAIPLTQLTQETRDDLTNQIQQGRVWLLLDGVDEISGGEASHQPLEEISRQLTGWVGRSSRVVLTCRLNVWQADRNALETFETYRLLDFDYPQQVHQFIDNWFVEDIEKGQRLKTQLDSSERVRLRDLVQTPLRLALLCAIWESEEGNLPETKEGLYHQCVQQFYKWKQNCTVPFRTSIKDQWNLNQALGRLALRDINEGSSRFRLRESFIIKDKELGYPDDETSLFYKALKLGWLNDIGIAAESPSKEKVYAFYHATFEEYFAALAVDEWCYFLKHVHENPEQGTYRIFEPQWKEVILLWLGREHIKEQKEEFIKALVQFEDGCNSQSQIPDWKGFYEYRAYFLAAAGIAEFKDCSLADVIVAQIVKWSFGYFNSEKQEWQKFNIEIQHKAKAVIEETERKKTITVLEELIRNSLDEDTCMQAAVTLGKIAKDNPIVVKVLEELIGIFKSERIGIQTALNFGEIAKDNPIAITALVELIGNPQSANNRIEAAVFLEKIAKDNPIAITALVELIENSQSEDTRIQAAEILGKIAKDNPIAITALVELIENSQSEDTRIQAAESLGKIAKDNPIAIRALVELIENSQSENTRIQAAESLGKIAKDNPIAIRALVELIENSQSENTRIQAAESLGKIAKDNPIAIRALVELIENSQSENTRIQAAESLGKIAKDNPIAIRALVELIENSQSENTRIQAAESLGKIAKDNPIAITALEALTENSQSENTRIQATESLGKIAKDNPIAITALVELIENSQSEDTRRQAALTLGEIAKDNPISITALVELLVNSMNVFIPIQAAKSLGKIAKDNLTAIMALVELLGNSQSEYIRLLAAETLGEIAKDNLTAIMALVELLGNSLNVITQMQVADNLKKLLTKSENMKVVVIVLKNHLSNQAYEVIWHCTQTMTYPAFYQAWHR